MRERELYVRFGQPFVWQQRNSHKLLDDLAAEVDGMLGIVGFAQRMAEAPVDTKVSVVENCRQLWKRLGHSAYLPSRSTDCALAFLDDCDAVLKARA
jgi:hypothetical protein